MSQIKFLTLLFIFFIGSSFSNKNIVHDIHVTKCNIDFAEQEKSLQITLHIYLDDLEADIKKGGVEERLQLCTEKEHQDGDKILLEYFQKKFSIEVNQQPVTYTFLGKEPTEDLLGGWFYLEVKDVESLKDLKINYSILNKLYSDQQAIIKVKGPNKKKGYFLLNNERKEASVTF